MTYFVQPDAEPAAWEQEFDDTRAAIDNAISLLRDAKAAFEQRAREGNFVVDDALLGDVRAAVRELQEVE